jgi:protoheme IX farnesyltransferase
MSARRLFRASLLHLPLFMGAMLLHRIPHTQDQPQHLVTQLRLGLPAPGQQESSSDPDADGPRRVPAAAWPHKGILGALSAAPFPFLPVPLQLRCPSKAACEAAQAADEPAAVYPRGAGTE